MRILLDTNTYSAFASGDPHALKIIQESDRIYIPVPVMAELLFGFLNGAKSRQNEANLTRFLDSTRVEVLRCDESTARHYSLIKLQLRKQGTPIPINDVWIAALAIQHELILYTFDSDFNHLPQLARI